MIFLDIHTHLDTLSENVIAIHNLIAGKDPCTLKKDQYYSCGMHPWYLSRFKEKWKIMEEKSLHPQIVAIGECGLDYRKKYLEKFDKASQKKAFEKQIIHAENIGKPLIIHCVKAFDQLLKERKRYPANQWILHGFDKNKDLAKQLIQSNIHLSFGAGIIKHSSTAEALRSIPQDFIFLETDDQAEYSIEEIYMKAASLLGISVKKLYLQILQNAEKVFGVEFERH